MSQQNVSSSSSSSSVFEGVKVSVGFVRGLQSQIFKLEQTQQDLISQLEHANALATEFHETIIMYQRKYDEVLRQMEEMRREHGYEKAILAYNLEAANEEVERQRELNHEQGNMTQTFQDQSTLIAGMTDMELAIMGYHEELSPVSISSPSPRTPRTPMTPRARTQTPTLDPETPTSEPETPVAYAFRASPSPSPPSFRFQCSAAMASCDGLYAQWIAAQGFITLFYDSKNVSWRQYT